MEVPASKTSIEAAELFEHHVADIRRYGDGMETLGAIPDPVVFSLATFSGAALNQTAKAMAAVAEVGTNSDYIAVAFTTLLAGSATMTAKLLHSPVYKYRKLIDASETSQAAVGQVYDIFTTSVKDTEHADVPSKSKLVMRWYGPVESSEAKDTVTNSTSEAMVLMAGLARENGIDAVMVGADIISEKKYAAAQLAIGDPVDMVEWVNRRKPTNLKFQTQITADGKKVVQTGNDTVYVFEPHKLEMLAAEMQDTHPGLALDGMDKAIAYLRLHKPEHPLVKQYDNSRPDQAHIAKNMKKTARSCLTGRLHTVDTSFFRGNHTDPQPRRLTVNREARIKTTKILAEPATVEPESVEDQALSPAKLPVEAHTVAWRTVTRPVEVDKTDLFQALDLDIERHVALLKNPGSFSPKDVALAIEYAAYTGAFPVKDTAQSSTASTPFVTRNRFQTDARVSFDNPKSGHIISAVSKDGQVETGYLRTRNKIKKSAATFSLVLIGMGGAISVDSYVDAARQEVQASAVSAYAAKLGTASENLSQTQQTDVIHAAMDEYPLLSVASSIQTKVLSFQRKPFDTVSTALGFQSSQPKNQAPKTGVSGIVGLKTTVGNTPASPSDQNIEWNVISVGDATTVGYWSNDVSSTYQIDGEWAFPSIDERDDKVADRRAVSLEDDKSTSYVEVDRQVTAHQMRQYWRDYTHASIDYFISVPVLENMQPYAVSYGNSDVTIIARSNGTYAFKIPKEADTSETGTLTYRLKRLEDKPPHPVGQTIIDGDITDKIRAINDADLQAVQSLWEQKLPRRDETDTEYDRRKAEYIRQHTNYSLEPMSSKTADDLTAGALRPAELISRQLAVQRANCNVATTSLALSELSLGYAEGYGPDAANDGALRSGEAHAWAVTSSGEIIDATPAQTVAPSTASSGAFLRKLNIALLDGLAISMTGLVGISVYRNRGTIRRQLAAASVGRTSLESLATAKLTIDQAAYATHFEVPKLDFRTLDRPVAVDVVDRSTETAKTTNQRHRTRILDELKNPVLQGGHVALALDGALSSAQNLQERRTIRRSKRLLRRIGLTGTVMYPQSIDQTDILR